MYVNNNLIIFFADRKEHCTQIAKKILGNKNIIMYADRKGNNSAKKIYTRKRTI